MTNKCLMLYNHFISLYINYNIVIYLDPCTFGMGPFSMLKNMFAEVCNAPKLPVIPIRTPWSCGVSNGWLLRSLAVWNGFEHKQHFEEIESGQIIATSHDLTPNGGLVREIPLFQGNLGW